MEFLRNVFLFAHFLGLAVLIGAFVVQIGQPALRITSGMLHGAATMLVSGIGLVATVSALHNEHPLKNPAVDNPKITVKLVVLLAIFAVILVNRKKEKVGVGPWLTIGLLSILNVGIAVFWT